MNKVFPQRNTWEEWVFNKNLDYAYRYDVNDNMVWKQLPDIDSISMQYNARNQLVLVVGRTYFYVRVNQEQKDVASPEPSSPTPDERQARNGTAASNRSGQYNVVTDSGKIYFYGNNKSGVYPVIAVPLKK